MKFTAVAVALICGFAQQASSMQTTAQLPVACTTPITGGAPTCVPVEMRDFVVEFTRESIPQADQGQLMLRFQLIEASTRPASANRDPAIAAVDTVLRDLFRYSNYQLVSEAVVASAATNGRSSLLLSGGNNSGRHETYQLDVTIYAQSTARGGRDASLGQPPPIQIAVSLKEVTLTRTETSTNGGNQLTGSGQAAVAPRPTPRTVLETTVTMSPGHTVVLGSTQPGGGPGADRTLILVMRPEIRKY